MKKKPYILPRVFTILIIQCIITAIVLLSVLLIERVFIIDIIIKIAMIEMLLFGIVFYIFIMKPLKEMNKAFQAFAEGYTVQDIFSLRYGMNNQHESMLYRLSALLNSKQILQSSKKQAEYLALQNQINPHFLYNTLEGIRSEAFIGGMNSVAEMAETLAKFFRYTISNINTLVTVEDELDNVRNYCLIQQFRFDDRICLEIKYEDHDEKEIRNIQMPKLILQPIVENAIRHGIEPKIGIGVITIRMQISGSRLVIFVSDNGIGMSSEALTKLTDSLKGPQMNSSTQSENGGIAMANVNTRIKLIFGDEYGIHVYSTPNLGTDVEIILPIKINGADHEKRSSEN